MNADPKIILKSNFINQSSVVYRFCQGENDAMGEVFAQMYAELCFIAFRFVENEKDAEDIVADCFEKLISITTERRNILFIENSIEIKSYLIVMVKHKSLDFLKVKKNRHFLFSAVSSFWRKNDVNEHSSRSENDHILHSLEILTDREKEIMKLSIEGYGIDEIKEKLLISKKTISNTLHAARKKIKIFLDE